MSQCFKRFPLKNSYFSLICLLWANHFSRVRSVQMSFSKEQISTTSGQLFISVKSIFNWSKLVLLTTWSTNFSIFISALISAHQSTLWYLGSCKISWSTNFILILLWIYLAKRKQQTYILRESSIGPNIKRTNPM